MPISEVRNIDCMLAMKEYPDKFFDLAIVDPEYGIDAANMTLGTGKKRLYSKKDWDKHPASKEYFVELFRVSANQVVWGGNYFANNLPVSRGWIFWDKLLNKDVSFSDGELAWTSFDCSLKTFKVQYSGFIGQESKRIHPTEKPIKLYKKCLEKFANPGNKVLDTHLGSGSSRIAAYDMGFDFYGFEIDKDYFESQEKRFKQHIAQLKIFA